MLHIRVSFDEAVHEELVTEIEKSAVYATTKLHRLRVTPDRRAAEVDCTDDGEAEVRDKVQKLTRAMTRGFRELGAPESLARTSRRDEGPIADAFAELERRRWVRPIGRGQVSFAGGACALERFIDDAVRAVALRELHATEESHPALLESDVLARCGYFTSFPHSVCLVSHLTEDFDAIEAFRAANTDSAKLTIPDPSALAQGDAALRPAVCLPVYRALQGTTLPSEGLVVTTSGKAFRYESRNMEGIQRLWDFSMREIIFLGSTDFVEGARERIQDSVKKLLEEWDLEARIESASDPFFATVRATKALWQRSRALKYEMMVDVGSRSIAAGSINFAGELFGNAFEIEAAAGKAATTACVGFGLERLVLAMFAQHGFDPARWPRAIREVVFG